MAHNNSEPIPFLDLSEQFRQLKPEIDRALEKIFQKTSFVLGPEVAEFESEFANYCEAKHCISVHNGTAALHLALLAMDVGPGDEVITAPNSFIATAEAIAFCGATARFVDVLQSTSNLDTAQLEAALRPNTRAVIPVHLYGQPANMDRLQKLASKVGFKIIEDACQAHGATFMGKRVGTMGEAGCFSFYPGKNLGAAGDGGAIVTNDDELAEKLRLLRNHGSSKKYHHEALGHNFRLDTIQAAVLSIKLKHLDKWNSLRQEHAHYYSQQLVGMDGVIPHATEDGAVSVHHLYVVKVANRHVVEKVFQEHNIGYGIHYPVPIHLQPAFAKVGYKKGSFPVTEKLAEQVISLPMYPELKREQQERVVIALAKAAEQMRTHVEV